MTMRRLATPWASPGDRQFSLPTSLILKMGLGEAPENIPYIRDVSRKVMAAATSIDGGAVDRIANEHSGGFRCARLFSSAAHSHQPGQAHCDFDGVEQATGLARTFILRVPAGTAVGQLCETLAQISSVESASPNYVCTTPFDVSVNISQAASAEAWAPRQMIRMDEALAIEGGDDAVMVGLIDSGIAKNHVELNHAFRAGYDTVRLDAGDIATGIKLLGDHRRNDSNPEDLFVGHGMGCAGIISARGKHMPVGQGGASRIIPMRALAAARLPGKSQAVGLGAISDLDMAMKIAIDLGAKVINMSFGTDDSALAAGSPKPHADVVDYALARGCILIAASGNNGEETRYWPAAYPGVIAVGAVDASGMPTGFSTRGDHVALCAPGDKILTTGLQGYQFATGTSFAAPFVSGAAALLVSRGVRRAHPINADTVRRILLRTAQPFSRGNPGGCGAGILDSAAALRALDAEIDAVQDDFPERVADPPNHGGADDG